MTAACAALGASLSGEPAQPFALPVKESAFELRAKELFSMGENALDGRDWLGALSYFHELRGKLSSEVGTADYALVSALLAEACLGFQPQVPVTLAPAAGGGRIVPARLSEEALAAPLPQSLPTATRNLIGLMRVRQRQFVGDWRGAEARAAELWGMDARESRLSRLGDLYNWTLLAYMQSLSALADGMDEASATPLWRQVLRLGEERVERPTAQTTARSGAEAAVQARRGETLARSPRRDVLPVEFVRLRACALLAVGDDASAERELRQPGMSVYPAERAYLLLTCLARQGKAREAEEQYARCVQEHPLRRDAAPLLRLAWRKALWTLLEMRYATDTQEGVEELLGELEPLLQPAERLRWLRLRLRAIDGQLSRLESSGEAGAGSALERIHSSCLKFSALFPGVCLPQWLSFVRGLPESDRRDYYEQLAQVTCRLAQAQARAGNLNTAIELLELVGGSHDVGDALRYEAFMSLGDIAAGDVQRSIAAYRHCETLAGVSSAQKAEALYRASRQALTLAARSSASAAVRETMAREAESLLRRLCADYGDTPFGREAAYTLAEHLYGQRRYEDAAAFYERYFMGGQADPARRDQARLRWSRCWRLLAEGLQGAESAPRREALLRKALSVLTLLQGDGVTAEVAAQASLETYRVLMSQGETPRAQTQLDGLIESQAAARAYGDVLWAALYERMLNRYQRHELAAAAADGLRYEELRVQSRLESVPWERETFLLMGDIEAARAQWKRAAALYSRLELLPAAATPGAPDEQSLYAFCQAAFCLARAGELDSAYAQLRRHLEAVGAQLPRPYAYQGAMLLGDIKVQQRAFADAQAHFEQAQRVYGQDDTYKTNLARCRQGEMLLLSAEETLRSKPDRPRRELAIAQLEQASAIFAALLDVRRDDGGAATAAGPTQDHCFDLYLRAQYGLGGCFELAADDPNPDVAASARERALWCYKRICDYFIARARQGQALRSSRYYVKSLDSRIRLLTGTAEPPTRDVMDMVARLYEEYAELNLEGSILARHRAEKIRRTWR